MRRQTIILICLSALTGCVPVVERSPRYDVEGAEYVRPPDSLGKLTPSDMVLYPFHGIYISFQFGTLAVGLHVPAGVQVQVTDPTISLTGTSKKSSYERSWVMQGTRHEEFGFIAQFEKEPDPFYKLDDYKGVLPGSGIGTGSAWYLFRPINPQDPQRYVVAPEGLLRGTIRLPALSINGQQYDAQTLSFTNGIVAGVICAMC